MEPRLLPENEARMKASMENETCTYQIFVRCILGPSRGPSPLLTLIWKER